MYIRPIQLIEDRNNPLFQSTESQDLLAIYNEYYAKIGFVEPWVGYMIVYNDQVCGSCGFVSPPLDGVVEIAYWTFSEFEGKGIASFACGELIKIATIADPSILITAKTAPEYNASTRILEKHGFRFSKIVQDHEIGDAWLWERQI